MRRRVRRDTKFTRVLKTDNYEVISYLLFKYYSNFAVNLDKVNDNSVILKMINMFDDAEDLKCIFENINFNLPDLIAEVKKYNRHYYEDCIYYDEVNDIKIGEEEVEILLNDWENKKIIEERLSERLIHNTKIIEKKLKKNRSPNYLTQISFLVDFFKLNQLERNLVEVLYLKYVNSDFTDLIDEFTVGDFRSKFQNSSDILSLFLNEDYSTVKEYLKDDSKLIKFGIFNTRDNDLDENILNFIHMKTDKPFSNFYFKKYEGDVLQEKHFDFEDSKIKALDEVLNLKNRDKGAKILFYGKPGTGKTELARLIAKRSNRDLYVINQYQEKDGRDDSLFRFKALRICELQTKDLDPIVLIDEADEMLGNGTGFLSLFFSGMGSKNSKSDINDLLDNSSITQIWITNNKSGIDPSTHRRFDYIMEFEDFTLQQRVEMWKRIVDDKKLNELLPLDMIEEYADNYLLNPGIIDKVLSNVSDLMKSENVIKMEKVQSDKYLIEMLNTLIESYLPEKERLKSRIKESSANFKDYSIEGVQVKEDIENIVNVLRNFCEYLEKNKDVDKSLNLLMHGPSGTGKTELAKYIARKLKKQIIIVKASDILDPFVGMNEKNISNKFKEAKSNNAILFFDEIDTFLSGRSSLGRTWERSMVNEMLTNIENFRGVFIGATNFKELIDFAAIRRFSLKLEFDYLDDEGKMIFYKRFFNTLLDVSLNQNELLRLKGISNLTPGDFKVIYEKVFFLDDKLLSNEMLISELEREVKNKNFKNGEKNKVGFVK